MELMATINLHILEGVCGAMRLDVDSTYNSG